jgi:hypothetical protein
LLLSAHITGATGKYSLKIVFVSLRAVAIAEGYDRAAGWTGIVEDKKPVELVFFNRIDFACPKFLDDPGKGV